MEPWGHRWDAENIASSDEHLSFCLVLTTCQVEELLNPQNSCIRRVPCTFGLSKYLVWVQLQCGCRMGHSSEINHAISEMSLKQFWIAESCSSTPIYLNIVATSIDPDLEHSCWILIRIKLDTQDGSQLTLEVMFRLQIEKCQVSFLIDWAISTRRPFSEPKPQCSLKLRINKQTYCRFPKTKLDLNAVRSHMTAQEAHAYYKVI